VSTPGAARPKEVEGPARIVDPLDLAKRSQEIVSRIAQRAFEIFESRGRAEGQEFGDWLRAESELLHPTHLKLSETEKTLHVRMDVPGFEAGDIRISVEPSQLTVLGERTAEEKHKTRKTIYSETCSDQIYRVVGLPAEVQTRNAKTAVKKGVLEIELQKAAPAGKPQE